LPIDLVITDGTGGMVWTRGCPDHRRRVGGPARELKTVLLRLIGFTDIERKEPPSKKPPIKPPTRRKKPPIKESPDPPNPDDQAPIGDSPLKRGPKRVLLDGSLPTPNCPRCKGYVAIVFHSLDATRPSGRERPVLGMFLSPRVDCNSRKTDFSGSQRKKIRTQYP
jgi:hypothetical protein